MSGRRNRRWTGLKRPPTVNPMKPVSFDAPAALDVICPHCQAANVPLRGGVVKAYIMRVKDDGERAGYHFECAQCSHAWPDAPD